MTAGKFDHLHRNHAISLGNTYFDSESPYENFDKPYHAVGLQDGMQELAGVQRAPILFLHPDPNTEVEGNLKNFCFSNSVNSG